jgi:hypothetical protein
MIPSWSGGFCDGPLLTRGIRRILMVRRILLSDFAVKTEKVKDGKKKKHSELLHTECELDPRHVLYC